MSSFKSNENIHKKEDGSYYMPTTTPALPSPPPRGNLNNFIKGVQTLRKFRFWGQNSVSDEKTAWTWNNLPSWEEGAPYPFPAYGLDVKGLTNPIQATFYRLYRSFYKTLSYYTRVGYQGNRSPPSPSPPTHTPGLVKSTTWKVLICLFCFSI